MSKLKQIQINDDLAKVLADKAKAAGLDESNFIKLLIAKYNVILCDNSKNIIEVLPDNSTNYVSVGKFDFPKGELSATPLTKQVIPEVPTVDKYTENQAKAIVIGWYVKNPDKDMTKKLILEQAKELANNPELIKFYT